MKARRRTASEWSEYFMQNFEAAQKQLEPNEYREMLEDVSRKIDEKLSDLEDTQDDD